MNDLIRTPLDERSLVDLTNKNPSIKFKYFAIDGSFIIALLEKPLVKSKVSSNYENYLVKFNDFFNSLIS
jgi:hypothetical protein